MTETARKPRRYRPPASKDGSPLPPADPTVSIIVRSDPAVPIRLLTPFHKNPNRGDTGVIRESIAENGLFRSVVVNVGTLTGRPHEILAGNHTVGSAEDEGRECVPVDWVDVDNARAVKIVTVDNASAKKGRVDDEVLASLLVDLDDLVGTGITDEELARMTGTGTSGDGDDDEADDRPAFLQLVIDCEDETEQQELYDRLTGEGLTVRALTM